MTVNSQENHKDTSLSRESVSKIVQKIIDKDIAIQDALYRGYGNLSAMARIIKPRVENNLNKRVNLQSVITAVKRTRKSDSMFYNQIRKVIASSIIKVRTDIVKLSIKKTNQSLLKVRTLMADFQENFLQISESATAITLIFDYQLFKEIYSLFDKNEIFEKRTNLSAIIISSSEDIITVPGCLAVFFNQIAKRRINIDATTSCFTDTIIIVKMEDITSTFSILNDLISDSRNYI